MHCSILTGAFTIQYNNKMHGYKKPKNDWQRKKQSRKRQWQEKEDDFCFEKKQKKPSQRIKYASDEDDDNFEEEQNE